MALRTDRIVHPVTFSGVDGVAVLNRGVPGSLREVWLALISKPSILDTLCVNWTSTYFRPHAPPISDASTTRPNCNSIDE